MSEKRFTLEEARIELALQECREHGHDWTVIVNQTFADPAGEPVRVVCDRCLTSRRVEASA
jgi:hypothetical protein